MRERGSSILCKGRSTVREMEEEFVGGAEKES